MNRKMHPWSLLLLVVLAATTLSSTSDRAGTAAQPAKNSHGVDPNGAKGLVEAYGMLPLSFEANQGQTDARVKFLSRGTGYTFFVTPTEAVWAFSERPGKALATSLQPGAGEVPASKFNVSVLRMKLVGANHEPKLTGLNELLGKSNYFIGNDSKKWRTHVPTYEKVHYQDIYPGVDLVYHGNQRQLEYDFIVKPGADANRILLDFQGANTLEVSGQGDLVLNTAAGAIRQQKPLTYQEVDGVRREIASGYVLRNTHQVGFQLSAYDHTRPLIVDPVLVYSTFLGGSRLDQAFGIAVDTAGNAYVTGLTQSTNFPTTSGTFQASYPGAFFTAFVTKLNPAGSSLVYSTYLGGTCADDGFAVAVDAVGDAFVTGETCSGNFPTTTGAFQTALRGNSNVFVAKLDPTGSSLLYSTFIGGSINDRGRAVALDIAGNAYVTGFTNSSNFPTTPGAFQPTYGGGPIDSHDGFVAKVNTLGTGLVYSTYLGGSGEDSGVGIAVDSAGNAYVTGPTAAANFPTTPGAFQTFLKGSQNIFVSKLNPAGSGLIYSTYLGGSGSDDNFGPFGGIALNSVGNAYVTGSTGSLDFPTTPGAFQTSFGGGFSDAYVTELNPTGSGLVYSTYLGGTCADVGYSIALDTAGDAHVAGETCSTNFPTANPVQASFGGGPRDAFVTKVNPLGTGLVYSTYLGGSGADLAQGIALDDLTNPNAYVTGITTSDTFPTTPGAFQRRPAGSDDGFVTKIADVAFEAPITAMGASFVATEGVTFTGTVATFTDPDPASTAAEYSATIDWGDTTPTTPGTISGPTGGPFTVTGTHMYAEDGAYSVTAVITDIDTPSNTATAHSTASVSDAPLASRCATTPVSAQTYNGPTTIFTDQSSTGTLSDFSATISWGDASSSAGTISGGPGNAPYTVNGTHTYASTGTFTITTSIKDVGGSTTTSACSVIIFAFATGRGAAFVIGDLEAGLGNHVTWWNSQWANINLMSGGAPPNAMKGFAGFEDNFLGLPPPNCGGTWSTDPGNSAPPPPSVPNVMGVIVSSRVTQSGSAIIGDIKQVVIVRNDPGYAPAPGHPGTGTEIAVFCMTP